MRRNITRYRGEVRFWGLLLLVVAACGKDTKDAPRPQPAGQDARAAGVVPDAAPQLKADSYPTLAAALAAIIPADARVIGIGEMHNRTDRKAVTSALSRFTTDGLPALADRMSDLIVETWFVDPKCGTEAQKTTAKVEIKVRRPQETKSEIALLAEAARAARVQPHAMKLKCEDFEKVAPGGKDVKTDVMLDLITSELGRIADQAVAYRAKAADKRPWIAIYGGAMHNDRFPLKGLEQWSYAARVDQTTGNKYIEIDLIVPELADGEEGAKTQPWYPLIASTEPTVKVWQRGERSFVVLLPRSQ